ncbi:MAG TPA: hypothetical protein ENK57_25145, partial [Polyangiaceae bacterium]|nr:hypothetical protein [Polyangiaceae bacterium]
MSGCALMGPWGGSGPEDDSWTYSEHSIDAEIQQASLSGDMADLGAFDGDAYEATYDGWGGASTITLHAGQDGGSDFGWAMLGLTTYAEGGFQGDTFAPGARLTLESGELDAQGCTGP